MVYNHKKIESLSTLFLYKTETWYSCYTITKLHDMSTMTFPWQHNGLRALSFQRGKSEFSSFKKCYLLLLLVVVSEYGHYTAQAQESLLNSGATNRAVFILGR